MVDKQKYLQRLKVLYELKTGKVISDLEALNLFESLIVLTRAIYKPINKNHANKKDEHAC